MNGEGVAGVELHFTHNGNVQHAHKRETTHLAFDVGVAKALVDVAEAARGLLPLLNLVADEECILESALDRLDAAKATP